MTQPTPKWKRRKDDRPAEILSAALDAFAENGFAETKLADVAKRAGVAKGTLYLYFDNKQDLFAAAVRHGLLTNLAPIEQAAASFDGGLAELTTMLLSRAADRMGDPRLPAIVRMVIGESRAFPELARIWHAEAIDRVMSTVAGIIEKAQARGTAPPGDPKLYVLSIMGPMMMAMLFHQVFGSDSAHAPDLGALAEQHGRLLLHGIEPRAGEG
ncbi:TetR/AcrR family transcriptional regulator [Xanthomonas bundabergensis]|uniref:TetR/AcrR family transcriptional regulator n=1 Tax=Xanthomonas bundabergensis TaxID=3160842 RepID=UPI003518090A